MDINGKKAYLYGDAHVDYGTIQLDANYIEIDWTKSEVFARGNPDTIGGDTIGLPYFREGTDEFVAEEMRYNFKTNKGIIKKVVTQEGEGFIHGETIKVNEKKELFIGDAVYTTCNLEHPHFAILSKKIKVVPDKLAVTGPFNLAIAGVKTPLGGPFGLFPLPKDRTSGFIMPQYGQRYGNNGRGFFLQNGGWYFAISDKVDAELTGDVYSNGSWRGEVSTNYKVRYKYEGNATIAISRLKKGFDRDTFNIPKGYMVKWKHSPKGGRIGKLTSSVDIRSANYNRENIFSVNQSMMNNFSSSISYQKKLGKGPFSITTSLRQSQIDSTQTYTLPDFGLIMSRQQPFKGLPGKSDIWYKKIGIGYTMKAKNETTNKKAIIQPNGLENGTEIVELDFLDFNTYINNSRNGINHNIPITLPSFKVMKHFNITPTANYSESWYNKSLTYNRVDSLNRFAKVEEVGFNRVYNYSGSLAFNTRLYGYLNVGRFGLQRIRQTMRPTINYTYSPDFGSTAFNSKFYQNVIDTAGVESQKNRYSGFVFGGPSNQEQQTVRFSIDNMFEGKYKSRKDTSDKSNYFVLFDNINVATSYNFAADSLNWTPLKISGRTTFKGININFGSTHDLYDFKLDSLGRARTINEFDTKNGRITPRLTSFNVSFSYNLNPKKRKKEDKVKDALNESENELENLEVQRIYDNIDEYVDFDIPWSLRMAYNVTWSRKFTSLEPTVKQSFQLNGDVSLTPKWKFTFSNAGYDIVEKKILPAQVGIIRDLHCWEMRFSYVPFGITRGFTFDINVKASMLQSLKLSKQDDPRNRF